MNILKKICDSYWRKRALEAEAKLKRLRGVNQMMAIELSEIRAKLERILEAERGKRDACPESLFGNRRN